MIFSLLLDPLSLGSGMFLRQPPVLLGLLTDPFPVLLSAGTQLAHPAEGATPNPYQR